MAQSIKMYSAEAIADAETGRRLGARHAMLVFIVARPSLDCDERAIAAVEAYGWTMVNLKRSKILDSDLDLIEDETLRNAAVYADTHGAAIVVYADEMRPDG